MRENYGRSIANKEKVGNHYYSEGETITWEDTYYEDMSDIRNKIYELDIDL